MGRQLVERPQGRDDALGLCRKVDYNSLLSTLYGSVIYNIFLYIVWLSKFATEPITLPPHRNSRAEIIAQHF